MRWPIWHRWACTEGIDAYPVWLASGWGKHVCGHNTTSAAHAARGLSLLAISSARREAEEHNYTAEAARPSSLRPMGCCLCTGPQTLRPHSFFDQTRIHSAHRPHNCARPPPPKNPHAHTRPRHASHQTPALNSPAHPHRAPPHEPATRYRRPRRAREPTLAAPVSGCTRPSAKLPT